MKSGGLLRLERREVEKRVCTNERKRLTASAAFHDYRINRDYCGNINDAETNCVRFFKKTLPFYQIFRKLIDLLEETVYSVYQKILIGNRRNYV